MKTICVILVAVTLLTTSAIALDEVTVQLKWIHQAQFAGYYLALSEGFYQDEGLDVQLVAGGIGIDVFAGVRAGYHQFAVVGADSLLVQRSEGLAATAIATIYRINPFILVAFEDSGIRSPYDFPGTTIALTEGYNFVQFQAMMTNLGIDIASVDIVPYSYDDGPFLRGEIDVTVSYAAGSLLPLRDKTAGRPLTIIWPDDYGVHFYSDTIIASDLLIAENPDLIVRFLRATLQGHRHALVDPEAAINAAMVFAAVQDRGIQSAMLDASIPLMHTGQDDIGWMRPDRWQGMYDVLNAHGLLASQFDVREAFTLQFLELATRSTNP